MSDSDDRVVREIVVEAAAPIAFEVFTDRFDTWWPREHHLGETDLAEVVIEPREGGRWYERGTDGSECDWGRVLTWDPPNEVTLTWAISPRWQPESDPARASTVAVRFLVEGPSTTRVVFEHRDLDRHGEGWQGLREQVAGEGGWPGLLARYAEAARHHVAANG